MPHRETRALLDSAGSASASARRGARPGGLRGAAGEVHALTGANGAGKSTLMNILAGVCRAERRRDPLDGAAAALRFAGRRARRRHRHRVPGVQRDPRAHRRREHLAGPRAAHARRACSTAGAARRRPRACSKRYGMPLDPDSVAGSLSVADRQLVEIARALSASARILILDEPTAVLSAAGAQTPVRHRPHAEGARAAGPVRLAPPGGGVRDRRPGDGAARRQARGRRADRRADARELVRHMVGHEVDERRRRARSTAAGRAGDLRSRSRAMPAPSAITLDAGEIVGLGGLVGAGTHAAGAAARRARAPAWRSTTCIGERPFSDPLAPRDAIAHGIVYLTEDRKRDGMFADLAVLSNASAASLARLRAFGIRRVGARSAAVAPVLAAPAPRRHVAARADRGLERRQPAEGAVRARPAGEAASAGLRRADARRRRRRQGGDLCADRRARARRRRDRRRSRRSSRSCSRSRHRVLVVREAARGGRAAAGRAGARHR